MQSWPWQRDSTMDDVELQSLTDAEILRSVEVTIREQLLPALPADQAWARAVAVQLAGLVRYAIRRGPDATVARIDELADALTSLSHNDLVSAAWAGDRSQRAVMAAMSEVLVAAVTRADGAADEVRAVLRPLVVRQLDDELASTAPLVDAFRGKLDD
jgi:hypothetical protein